ncbi:MAG: prephenate dehydratase [Ignavibacteria bacterium]|nr:prephenate dehydratase [Ignavibacteria bacterium]
MTRVAFQGEHGAFSEIAAKRFFGDKTLLFPSATFNEVFLKIKKGTTDFGIVPVENSLYGSIFETFDLLLKYKFYIHAELRLKINHHLLAKRNLNVNKIEKVISHPQALGQCSNFLSCIKNVEITPSYDTAGSAKYLLENPDAKWAIVASEQAAKVYNLKVLKKNIQNNQENFTRFLVISKKKNPTKISLPKSSICFELKSMPGALFKALSVFALREIDLLRIESRPIPQKPFQYRFYCDFKGNLKDELIKNAIKHLNEISLSIYKFGSYEEGKTFLK